MIKIGLKITSNENEVKIDFVDPSKKELKESTEQEKFIAQAFKELFDEKLTNLLQEKINKKD